MVDHYYILIAQLEQIMLEAPGNVEPVLSFIGSDKDLERYFFNTIDDPIWFDGLVEAGMFKSCQNPSIVEDPENPDYFSMPFWPALSYLERVAEALGKVSASLQKLIEIIHEITQGSASAKPYPNPRTWVSLNKIISKLPVEALSSQTIELTRIWLATGSAFPLVSSQAEGELLTKLVDHGTEDSIIKAEILFEIVSGIEKDIHANEYRMVADEWVVSNDLIKSRLAYKLGQKCSPNLIHSLANRLEEVLFWKTDKVSNSVPLSRGKQGYSLSWEITREGVCTVIVNEERDERKRTRTIELFRTRSTEGCTNADAFDDILKTQVFSKREFRWMSRKVKPKRLYFQSFHDHSDIWIDSLSNLEHEVIRQPRELLSVLLLELVVGFSSAQEELARQVLYEFGSSQFRAPIICRIAIHSINVHWQKYRNVFWSLMKGDRGFALLNKDSVYRELFSLLENHNRLFTRKRMSQVLDLIDRGRDHHPQFKTKGKDLYWRQSWIEAFVERPQYKREYDKLLRKTKISEPRQLGRSFSAGIIVPESAFTVEHLESLDNEGIARALDSFVQEGRSIRGASVRGLGETLRTVVSSNPDRFTTDMSPFTNTAYSYVYYMLWGFKDVWKSKRDIEWEKIIDFLLRYCRQSAFWSDRLIVRGDDYAMNYSSVLSEIGWLIQDGTTHDERAIPAELHGKCKELLELVLLPAIQRAEWQYALDDKDPVTWTLNSSIGKLLTATLYLSLRISRLRNKEAEGGEKSQNWDSELQALYERCTVLGSPEAYVLVGQYMPQFDYLDSDWLEEFLKYVSGQPAEIWHQFMYGYLWGNRRYANFYIRMVPMYRKAMTFKTNSDNWRKMLAEHCALGYMAGVEGFSLKSGSHLRHYIDQDNADDLTSMINVFWGQAKYNPHGGTPEEQLPFKKFEEFWKLLYTKYSGSEHSEGEKQVLSELITLTVWLEELNADNTKWICQAVPYVQKRFNSSQFLEHLINFTHRKDKARTAVNLAKILDTMTRHYIVEYKEENVQKIIEFLYVHGNKSVRSKADGIIDRYARAGHVFLRDTWERRLELSNH